MKDTQPQPEINTSYALAANKTITVDDITFAYRELGPHEEIPVVFFGHLSANLDNWDPRIIDAIAAHRRVITFDQAGVGGSSGTFPATLDRAAEDAYTFITQGLGLEVIDAFTFSMGGMIAQDLIMAHPGVVRKLVLTGTGPRGGTGIDKVVGVTYFDVLRAILTRSDPKEFLFFNRDSEGKGAGKSYVARLNERTSARDVAVGIPVLRKQLRAIVKYGRSTPSDLSNFTGPTLIANGDNDRMVPSALSRELHKRIPGSELIIYPNSGHGGVFQYWQDFSAKAVEFLKA